ncbi:fimbrial tip adhesin FimD [Porphyromonas loveana]|uniref:fimbrial tip adhesin FimD n=1 Tax=Porphyromonas loveana TaxID=1884669 RepID=UPI0035A01BE3
MKTKFTIGLLVAFLMSVLTGCIREDIPDNGASSLVLRIQLSEQGQASDRAEEAGENAYQENTIDALTLVFYKAGSKVWEVAPTQQSEGNYYIPVPESMQVQFNGANEFKVYLVANIAGFTAPLTEAALQNFLVTNRIAVTAESGTPADRFAMVGSTAKNINMATAEGKQLGTIKLKRVAAKVRVNAPVVNVAGYELVGIAAAKFRNYRDKGNLITEAIPSSSTVQTLGYFPLKENNNRSVHFYSYYNSWEVTTPADQRPEIVLLLNLRKAGETTAKPYYYRVPIEAADMKIRSNYLYSLSVTIEVLGALNEGEAVAVQGNFNVQPWTEHSESQTLPDTQYLEVIPQETVMNMIEEVFLDYKSSSSIVIENIKASYTYVDGATGQEITTYYQANQTTPPAHVGQFPSVTEVGGKIRVYSKLPVNNVPKKITFRVRNQVGGLTKDVTIKQNPSEYVVNTTGTASAWQPGGNLASGLNNKAIYHIVILSPSGNMILGFPPRESRDFYRKRSSGGVEYKYTDNVTVDSPEVSKMVSPSFELASQLGATVIQPYKEMHNGYYLWSNYANSSSSTRNALGTCAEYWEERVVNGQTVTLDDWRLPTKAEIELVEKLQTDNNSAVQFIMTGRYYWSALSDAAILIPSGGSVSGVSTTRAHVRCVRDVKDDIRKK